jgi:hypothetical protein
LNLGAFLAPLKTPRLRSIKGVSVPKVAATMLAGDPLSLGALRPLLNA